MTKQEAIDYCYFHEEEYKADAYANSEDGYEQFNCLISGLQDGYILPEELSDYGMNYVTQKKCTYEIRGMS